MTVRLTEQPLQTPYTNQRSRVTRNEGIVVLKMPYEPSIDPKHMTTSTSHRYKTHWEVTNQCHKSSYEFSCASTDQMTSLTFKQPSIAIVGTCMITIEQVNPLLKHFSPLFVANDCQLRIALQCSVRSHNNSPEDTHPHHKIRVPWIKTTSSVQTSEVFNMTM